MVDTMDEVLKIALAGPLPEMAAGRGGDPPVSRAFVDDTITH